MIYKRFLPEQIDKSHPLSLDLFHKFLIKVSYAKGKNQILKKLPVRTHRPQFDLLGEMTIQPKMEDFEEFLSSEELLDFRKRLLKLGLISLSYEPHLLPEDIKEIFEYLFGEYDSYICGLVPLIEFLLQDEQKIYVINENFLNSISNLPDQIPSHALPKEAVALQLPYSTPHAKHDFFVFYPAEEKFLLSGFGTEEFSYVSNLDKEVTELIDLNSPIEKLIFNLLIYINAEKEKFTEFKNSIRLNSKGFPIKEDKHLSQYTIIKVGDTCPCPNCSGETKEVEEKVPDNYPNFIPEQIEKSHPLTEQYLKSLIKKMLLSGEEKLLDLAPHLRNLVTPLRPKVLNSVDKRSLKIVTKDTTVSQIVEVYFENDLEGKIDFQKRLFKAALGVFNNVPTDMDLFMDMKEDLIFWMGINILHHYLAIAKDDRKVYMIHKNFYKTFTKLGIDYSFAHLPMNQTGFVVMPTPLEYPSPIEGKVHFDSFTYSICHENSFCFKNILQNLKNKYGYETSDGVLAISFINENLSMVSIVVPLPKDSNLKIKDLFIQHLPKGQDQFLKVASLLCYINTGNPDLSDFRNPIRYQSPTNKTPIKEDRHLSPANIVRIGFGWKKDRDWHIDQWDIKASEAVKWMRKEVAEKEGVFDPNAPTITNHKGTILYGIKRPRKETTGHRRMKKENK